MTLTVHLPGELVAALEAEAAYLIDRQLGPEAEASLYACFTSAQLEVASLDLED